MQTLPVSHFNFQLQEHQATNATAAIHSFQCKAGLRKHKARAHTRSVPLSGDFCVFSLKILKLQHVKNAASADMNQFKKEI